MADDTWLTLSPHQLDDMLNETYSAAFQYNDVTCDLGHVAENMKAFVNKVSSHEGAEFPSHDPRAGDDGDDDGRFDPSGFIQNMQERFGKFRARVLLFAEFSLMYMFRGTCTCI